MIWLYYWQLRVSGFLVSECHVYHSQASTLRYDVCTTKVELKHYHKLASHSQ